MEGEHNPEKCGCKYMGFDAWSCGHIDNSFESMQIDQVLDSTILNNLILDNGGYWGEHPDYPESDWKYEIANSDTRVGYWEWVYGKQMTFNR